MKTPAASGADVEDQESSQGTSVTTIDHELSGRTRSKKSTRSRAAVIACQIGLVVVFLAAWEFLPKIAGLRESSKFFDPFFISSPSQVADRTFDLIVGRNESVGLWDYLVPTLITSLLGTVIGMLGGALFGLLLSNFRFAANVLRPFLVAVNAMPRIALIPIVIVLFGPTLLASVLVVVMVVFFVAFFNAYEGGTSVPQHIVDNARLLGANQFDILFKIRTRFVMAWTLATLPLCVTFAIISAVTTEILAGIDGMGTFLFNATVTADASLTFSVVFILAVVGLVIVTAAEMVKRRMLHWWGS